MNDTSAANAWALKPETFAAQHNLVKHKVLDRESARGVFEAQIGPAHTGLEGWSPYDRALLAVFGQQVFLDDRKAATQLLDDLNRSCLVKGLLRRSNDSMTPLYGLADQAFERVAQAPGVDEWLKSHRSVRTALVALYGRDLRLPPARFRWLKGVDRTLWYALHSADTAKVFVEGAGVQAQARAEVHAQKMGLPRPGLMVNQAIEGLQTELESIGQVFSREVAAAKARKKFDIPAMTAVYAVQPTRITGKIMDPKDTLEILQLMAGTEYLPEMSGMVRQAGMMGSSWEESDSLSLKEQKKVSVEEVQQLQEGENITLFKGEVIRGSSLYIDDVDKLSKEAIQINRFIEVAPPELKTLLAGAPAKVRRSYPRVVRVQQILYRLAMKADRADLKNLVLTDPALATLNDLGEEWDVIWRRRPGAAVRSTLLWHTALQHVPKRGSGYQVQSSTAQDLAVGSNRLEAYSSQHASLASTTNPKTQSKTAGSKAINVAGQ